MNALLVWLQHPVTLPAWLAYTGVFAAFVWVVGAIGLGLAIWFAKQGPEDDGEGN